MLGPLVQNLTFGILIGALYGLAAVGLSLGLGALNVYYRDFRYALPLGVQLWMFASPVAYPVSIVPSELTSPTAFTGGAEPGMRGQCATQRPSSRSHSWSAITRP